MARSNRALINVWIPSVFLRGKATNAFHVYQVGAWSSVRMSRPGWNRHWSVRARVPYTGGQRPATQPPKAAGRSLCVRARPLAVAMTPQLGLLEQK